MKNFLKFFLLIACFIASIMYAMYLESDDHKAAKAEEAERIRLTPQDVTLRVLNYVDTYAQDAKVWEAIKADFEIAYPHIKLDVENLYDQNYHETLRNYAVKTNLPDVMYIWPNGRHDDLINKGLFADLSKYMDLSKWHDVAVRSQGLQGEVWAIPFIIGNATSIMYTNNALLQELGLKPPETYDDLKAMVKPLHKAGKEVVIMPNESTWVMSACLFSTILGRLAGPDWIKQLVKGEVKFTDKEFIDALYVVKNLYRDGILSDQSLLTSYGDGPGLFADERAPFFIDGQWRSDSIESFMDMNDISLTAFPALSNEVFPDSVSIVHGNGMAMNATISDDKKEAAIAFISFMADKAAAYHRYEEFGYLPSVKDFDLDIIDDIGIITLKKYDFYKSYKASTVVDLVLPTVVNDVLNVGLQSIALDEMTVEELAVELQYTLESM